MKNLKIRNGVGFIGIVVFRDGKRVPSTTGTGTYIKKKKEIDYYIVDGSERYFAFTAPYTEASYKLYKSTVPLNKARCAKSYDQGIMRVTNKLNHLLPYLAEEYELT